MAFYDLSIRLKSVQHKFLKKTFSTAQVSDDECRYMCVTSRKEKKRAARKDGSVNNINQGV
jgi:hypothetical protein